MSRPYPVTELRPWYCEKCGTGYVAAYRPTPPVCPRGCPKEVAKLTPEEAAKVKAGGADPAKVEAMIAERIQRERGRDHHAEAVRALWPDRFDAMPHEHRGGGWVSDFNAEQRRP